MIWTIFIIGAGIAVLGALVAFSNDKAAPAFAAVAVCLLGGLQMVSAVILNAMIS